jgi:hypothetical protein
MQDFAKATLVAIVAAGLISLALLAGEKYMQFHHKVVRHRRLQDNARNRRKILSELFTERERLEICATIQSAGTTQVQDEITAERVFLQGAIDELLEQARQVEEAVQHSRLELESMGFQRR